MIISKIKISPDNTIESALKLLNKTGTGSLVVVDKKNKLLGTISDGDLRKNILKKKHSLKNKISKIFNKKPMVVEEKNFNLQKLFKIFKKHKFDLIPVVDKNNNLKKVITWDQFLNKNFRSFHKKKCPVVIMAGGKGTRLKPFTNILPKPLIPIKNKPAITHIIENFSNQGFKKIHITVNFKSDILKAYFRELKLNQNINLSLENKALGTAGSLSNLKKHLKKDFIVTNCDILADIDFNKLIEDHFKKNNDMTITLSKKEVKVPYGVCNTYRDKLLDIDEKPTNFYKINVGIYVINSKIISLIPKNKFFEMTDLIQKAINRKFRVGVYEIGKNKWVDVGEWSKYHDAIKNNFFK